VAELRIAHLNRDAVVVAGQDAVAYLQGQLSQDVAALGVGRSAWSWILQPAGKVDALVRVTRTGPISLVVDVDEGYGEAVLGRLSRFKLRTRADLTSRALRVVALRGPDAAAVAERMTSDGTSGAGAQPRPPGLQANAISVGALWSGEAARDIVVLGGTEIRTDGPWSLLPITEEQWEAERIAAGVPAMGAELTERTIPAETGLVASTASFTKGCYTGQELVARIDSRGGNVPRHLRRLRSAAALTAGEELTDAAGKVVATVTSAAVHDGLGPVGLAYVARSVGTGDAITSAHGPVTVMGDAGVTGDAADTAGAGDPAGAGVSA
jgi:folate-binding protein YgfZ